MVTVHAKVIASLSPSLNKLVADRRHASQQNVIRFHHVEKEVFMAVVEFAYRQYYTIPSCLDKGSTTGDTQDVEQEVSNRTEQHCIVRRTQNEQDETGNLSLAQRWARRTYLWSSSWNPRHMTYESMQNIQGGPPIHRNYVPIFILHAKIYMFARLHLVLSLSDLALQRLHADLETFDQPDWWRDKIRIQDLRELATFAYSDDKIPDRYFEGQAVELRRLVLEFMVIHIHHLKKIPEIEGLMRNNHKFTVDLLHLLIEERNFPGRCGAYERPGIEMEAP
jgi:hypothetical protein